MKAWLNSPATARLVIIAQAAIISLLALIALG